MFILPRHLLLGPDKAPVLDNRFSADGRPTLPHPRPFRPTVSSPGDGERVKHSGPENQAGSTGSGPEGRH